MNLITIYKKKRKRKKGVAIAQLFNYRADNI